MKSVDDDDDDSADDIDMNLMINAANDDVNDGQFIAAESDTAGLTLTSKVYHID